MKRVLFAALLGLWCLPFVHAASVSINNVQNYSSILSNVTTEEAPLSHLTNNQTDLLLYYPFDYDFSSSTTIYDYSPNGNDGFYTAAGTYYNATGYIGGGVRFTANASVNITIPNAPSNNQSGASTWTMAAWVYLYRNNTGFLFGRLNNSNQGGMRMTISATGALNCLSQLTTGGSATAISSIPVPTLTWTHVLCVKNSSAVGAFIDGRFRATAVQAGTVISMETPLTTGKTAANSLFVNGTLDEIMFFNRSLSFQEISDLYNMTASRFAGPPAAQTFENLSIGQDGTITQVNITYNATLLNGSSMNLTILEYNSSNVNYQNTTPQTATDGDNQVLTFTTGTATQNVSTLVTFINNLFDSYSPVLRDSLRLDSYAVSAGGDPFVYGAITTQVFYGENTVQQYGPNSMVMMG